MTQLPPPQIDPAEVLKNSQVQQFWQAYTGQPVDTLKERLSNFQEKALQVASYRCIRTYSYLLGRISQNSFYKLILPDIAKKSILDIGCCFGTDIRKLIVDGANPKAIMGVDRCAEFFPLGHSLFQDEDRLPAQTFLQADFFDADFLSKTKSFYGNRIGDNHFAGFDIIQLGAVLHLLDQKGVIHALTMTFNLMHEGSILIGQTVGSSAEQPKGINEAGDLRFLHTENSLQAVMTEIGFQNVQTCTTSNHWPLWTAPGHQNLIYFTATK